MFKPASVCFWALCMALACGQAIAQSQPQPEDPVLQEETAGCADLHQPGANHPPVKINLTSSEMTFNQASRIPLDLHGHTLRKSDAEWDSLWGPVAQVTPVTLQHAADGSAFVEVIPPALGKIKLTLSFIFEDCTVEELPLNVNVPSPNQPPEKLILAWTNWQYVEKTGVAHLELPAYPSVVLMPLAVYRGVAGPVHILGDDISFTVIARKNEEPPLRFDPSFRSVTGIKPGQAWIKATFHGKSAYACMDVLRSGSAAASQSDCHDFLPPDYTGPRG